MIRRPAFGSEKRGVATGSTKTLPAPTGGWNTRDNEANMPVTKATILDNWFPLAANVVLRPGCLAWGTGLPSAVRSLLPYSGSGGSKLFAACDAGIYDVTASGAVGAVSKALTNGYLSHTMFTNIAGSFLFAVNGTDDMVRYDGTTWTSINATITGVATANLIFAHTFKRKLWFVQKSSMSAWYLPTNAIAGAAVEFPVGQIFGKGGHLVALGTWTIDGGSGMDDHLVFVSSEGELAVYKGTDPDVAANFELVGVYYLGEPLGRRCLAKFGGDLLYLSQNGLFPLSKALLSTSINYRAALSDEIGPTFAEHSSLYRDLEGWQPFVHPQGSALLVNVPIAAAVRYDQFVMNTVNQAWCRFTNWQATCWAMSGEEAYFGASTTVYKGFSGLSDNGANITAKAKQAYTYLGSSAQQKLVKMVRPLVKTNAQIDLNVAISVDFEASENFTTLTLPPASGAAWDTSRWDLAFWAADLTTRKSWYTVPTKEGYCAAILLQLSSNSAKVIWNATDVLYNRGGVL